MNKIVDEGVVVKKYVNVFMKKAFNDQRKKRALCES